MSTVVSTRSESAVDITNRILAGLFDTESLQRLHFRLWDGSYYPDPSPRPITIVLNHPGALRAMFLPGTEVALGEAYIYNDFDVEGDLEQLFSLTDHLAATMPNLSTKLRLGRYLLQLPDQKAENRRTAKRPAARLSGRAHSIARDRQAVTYHYNVSNDFYSLWLDKNMVYSCAYFRSPMETLDQAQEQKLDYICRKLRLLPGQRLLDIGCGWGGLVIHAARHYGVDATGITLSQPQADLANERIAAAGFSDRCRVKVMDYRELDEPEGYDALVSVGMFEHVGAAMLPKYFSQAYHLLRTGGVFLNHGIAIGRPAPSASLQSSFSQSYVFPDGELVPINVTLHAAEGSQFEVRDVESLREHYALTLRNWVRRLEANHDEALKFVDEPVYRTWRLFMSASAYGFSASRLTIYQTLLAKPYDFGASCLPLTREDWYQPANAQVEDQQG